jgi:DNA polymerase-3 subunit delta'
VGWTVVGQDAALMALRGALEHDRMSHAYLFAGPKHTGKTLTALQFAQTLNCERDERPCGRCRQCERIAAGQHPDVEIVAPGGVCDEENPRHGSDESRVIRICQVRRIERIVSRAPFDARYRVLIFEPADAIGADASHALLKTLEEPPPRVVMVLVTDREEMLLPTILSRTRRVGFAGQSRELIERTLRTRWDVEPGRAAELARLAGGRLGWAIVALHDQTLLERRDEALDTAARMAAAAMSDRMAFAAEAGGRYSRDRAGVQALLETWQGWWRDLLVIAAGHELAAVERERLDSLRATAAQCDVRGLARALRAITDARQQLEENASPALTLEAMMLSLPQVRPNAVGARLAG